MERLKLGLGTAQFGLDYGVSNRKGRTPPQEAERILEAAEAGGVRVLDTAALYGDSEEVLGSLLQAGHRFDLVTKLPSLLPASGERFDAGKAEAMLRRSLERLRQPCLYGLLLHRAGDLRAGQGEAVMDWLLGCKEKGIVRKIGVSVYAEDDVEGLVRTYPLDLVQAPVNVFDQRLLRNGSLRRCKEAGVEIHARSVFLQGLLLMDTEELPGYFAPYAGLLQGYRLFLERTGVDPVEAALTFVNGLAEVDVFVCGVNDRAQLLQILDCLRSGRRPADFSRYASTDPGLLNPYLWKL